MSLALVPPVADADTAPSLRRRAAGPVAAAALAVTSGAHIPVAIHHLHEVPYLGWLFCAFVAATSGGAAALLVTDRRAVWQLVGALNLGAIAVFVVSRLAGLPQASDDKGDWANPAALVCLGAQLVVVTVSCLVLRTSRR